MIRSLTIGLPIGRMAPAEISSRSRGVIGSAAQAFESAGLFVRTTRFTLPPVGVEGESEGAVPATIRWVDSIAAELGVRWYCLPFDFVQQGSRRERLATALDLVTRHSKLFMNFMVADRSAVSIAAVNDVADLVVRISRKSNNGFDNFRVGASFGCPANAPFFPFSRHEGDVPAFSLALETTGLALEVADSCGKRAQLDVFRDRLIERLADALLNIETIARDVAEKSGCAYRGVDASFAPFPDGRMSVAALVENLLGAPVGSHGTLFITNLLTDVIRTALVQSGATPAGFNGVMYSLLEDDHLAAANSRRQVTLDGLVSFAAVCGCGVDMVPIPGTAFPEEVAAVMLDIAGLSQKLGKPLGARMLPIPNKTTNEFTAFNLDFLCDSRVVGLTANDHRLGTSAGSLGLLTPWLPGQYQS